MRGEVVPGGDHRGFAPYPDAVADRSKRPTLMVWDSVTQGARPADAPGVVPALVGGYTVNGIPCKPVLQFLAERAAQYPPGAGGRDLLDGLGREDPGGRPALRHQPQRVHGRGQLRDPGH